MDDKVFDFPEKGMLSLIVSVYNEEGALPAFHNKTEPILNACGRPYELIYVNDGSRDRSEELLNDMALANKRVKVLHFSRNFGHEAAMIAGIDHAVGDALICMDADLQHPPSCIPSILELLDEGNDVVNMVRTANRSAGFLKNLTSSGFYALMNQLCDAEFQKNASDFFALSRRAADVLRENYREHVRFLRGYVQSIGFKSASLPYEAGVRAGGHSKYSIHKLFRFSVNTIVSFSDLPLRLGMYAAAVSAGIGMLILLYSLFMKMKAGAPDGYTTLIVVMCFMFSVLFLLIGIIGQYIGVLFQEIKGRPLYLVKETVNFKENRTDPMKKTLEA